MVGRFSTFSATILSSILLGGAVLSSTASAEPGFLVNSQFSNLFVHDLSPTEPDDGQTELSPVLDRMETTIFETVDGNTTVGRVSRKLNLFFRNHLSALSPRTQEFIQQSTQGVNIPETPLTRTSGQLGKLVQTIEAGEFGSELPEEFNGPQGFSLLRLLNYYNCIGSILAALKNRDVVINLEEQPVTFTINGKPYLPNRVIVLDGVVCEDPLYGKIQSRSWKYDASTGSGSFDLDGMIINRYTPVIRGGTLNFLSLPGSVYDWKIAVDEAYNESILTVARKDYDGTDPFEPVVPGTDLPPLPKQMFNTTPGHPDSVWTRGLTHRLYANGLGINVISVEERGVGPYPPTHPWRRKSENSCIDILFKDYFPADVTDFPKLQEGWCLGRCKKPMIANSR